MTVDGRLDELALAAVAAATGAWPYQPKGGQKTYVARGGKRFHLRTKNEEDDVVPDVVAAFLIRSQRVPGLIGATLETPSL